MKNSIIGAIFFTLSSSFICAADSVDRQDSRTEESIIEESISRAHSTPTSISGHGRVVRHAWPEPIQSPRPRGCLSRVCSKIKPLHVLLCSVVAIAGFAGVSYVMDERCTRAEKNLFRGCLAPETNMTGQCYRIAASRCYSYVNGGDYAYQATSPVLCSSQPRAAQDLLQTSAAKELVAQHPGAKLCVLRP